ncbi:MAG: hypothetical protein WCO94_05745 [Verrucomicrobiota bacterium]
MSPELIAKIRRSICIALEDMGGVNTRLREIEDKQALGNEAEEIEEWLFGASEQLELMAKEVRDWRATQ